MFKTAQVLLARELGDSVRCTHHYGLLIHAKETCLSRHWIQIDQQCSQIPAAHYQAQTTSGRRNFSSSSPSPSNSLADALGLIFNPSHIGAQTLEVIHSSTGLPWWAAIPATAAIARAALLPLSIKAHKASENLQLLNDAVTKAKQLTLDLPASDAKALGRTELVKAIYQYHKQRHKLPSLRWWWGNAIAQGAVLLTYTSALRAMSAAVWPGFTSEGIPGLQDLTSPPVFLSTLSTPFGTMGAVLPLAIVLTYVRALDGSTAAQVPGIGIALRLLAVPYYCLTLIQPHAVLLYWLTHTAGWHAVQSITPPSSQPSQPPATKPSAEGAIGKAANNEEATMLLALGDHYSRQKDSSSSSTAAVLCYSWAVKVLQQGVGQTASKLAGKHPGKLDATPGASSADTLSQPATTSSQQKPQGVISQGLETDTAKAAVSTERQQSGAQPSEEALCDEVDVDEVESEVDGDAAAQLELLTRAEAGLQQAKERQSKWRQKPDQ